jgi:AAA domain
MLFNEKTGAQLRGLTGAHVYIGIANGADAPELGRRINERLILAGGGFPNITSAGTWQRGQPARSVLDATVWQPERVCFIGDATCTEPVVQRRGEPEVYNAEAAPLALSDIPDLTSAERTRYDAIVAAIKEGAETERSVRRAAWIAERKEAGKDSDFQEQGEVIAIRGSHPIELADGRTVTVRDILAADPETFHTLHCADPIDPAYNSDPRIAQLYTDQGQPRIHSWAHGEQNYILVAAPEDEFPAVAPAPCATEAERLAALLGYVDPVLRYFLPKTTDVRTLVATLRAAAKAGDPLRAMIPPVFTAARHCGGFTDKLDRFSVELQLALNGNVSWSRLPEDDRRLLTLAAWLHTARPDAISGVNATLSPFLDPDDNTEPTWVVPGVIEEGGVSFVVGSSGVGKTALLAALGVSAARVPGVDELGQPIQEMLFGKPVKHGTVVVFTGEDARGAMRRAKRYAESRGYDCPEHFHVLPQVMPLANAEASAACWLHAESILPRGAPPVALVIVDHLRDALGAEDEDKATTVAPALQVAEGIAKMAKAAVIVAHHTGHEGTRERGSRVIRDKALATLLLAADAGGTVTAKLEKVKNGPDAKAGAAPLTFHLVDGVVVEGQASHRGTTGTDEPDDELVGRLVAAISLATGQVVSKDDLYAELAGVAPAVFGPAVPPNTLKQRRRRAVIKAAKSHYIDIDKNGRMQPGRVDLPRGVMPVGGAIPGGH